MIRACIETDQLTNRPTYPCHVMSSRANHPRVILSDSEGSEGTRVDTSPLCNLDPSLHFVPFWMTKPLPQPVMSSWAIAKDLSTSTWAPPSNFQTFRDFPSNIFSPRPKPRIPSKMPHRLVSWSVGQFYIRRASHFAHNFYLYIIIIYIDKKIF